MKKRSIEIIGLFTFESLRSRKKFDRFFDQGKCQINQDRHKHENRLPEHSHEHSVEKSEPIINPSIKSNKKKKHTGTPVGNKIIREVSLKQNTFKLVLCDSDDPEWLEISHCT